jgi:hypothetical protein
MLIKLTLWKAMDAGRVPSVVEKEKGVFSRYPKNSNWLMG